MVLVVAGLPATGKSTLAELVARDLAAPVFAWDRLMAPLKKHRLLAGLGYEKCLDLGFDMIQALVLNQLRLGQPAIVDSLVDRRRIDEWRAAVADRGGTLRVVECHCSDRELHRERLSGRSRDIPGWHEVDWAHVERMAQRFPPLAEVDARIDAVRPVAAGRDLINRLVRGA